jgi:uncharacterized protein YgbK (DUF1537 family)
MRDSDITRVLARQTPHRVGLIDAVTVRRGPLAIGDRLRTLAADDVRYAVVDVVADGDLASIATAVRDAPLSTGGAGLARHLALALASGGDSRANPAPSSPAGHVPPGRTLILSGSLSKRTGEQIEAALTAGIPAFRLDGSTGATPAIDWLAANRTATSLLVHAWAPPGERDADLAADIEAAMAQIACAAVNAGFHRIVVAGGETAGAVVEALGIRQVVVVAEEDRGVPWLVAPRDPPLALLLKSGNFGRPDLFVRVAGR